MISRFQFLVNVVTISVHADVSSIYLDFALCSCWCLSSDSWCCLIYIELWFYPLAPLIANCVSVVVDEWLISSKLVSSIVHWLLFLFLSKKHIFGWILSSSTGVCPNMFSFLKLLPCKTRLFNLTWVEQTHNLIWLFA